MRVSILCGVALLAITLFSCKKNKDVSSSPPTSDSTQVDNLVKDSSLLYAKDIYLWYNNIPTTFNARSYSDPNAIMEAIRAYSSEPGFTGPVDRWSFGMLQKDWDNLSSGVAADFGMGVFFFANNDLRVSHVESAGPAAKAGVTRAWRIKQFNGSSNITTSNANAIVQAVYQSSSTTFVFTKPSGTDTTITLKAGTYQENPFILDTVYNVSGKNVGYIVFNSFLGDTTAVKNQLQNVFSSFTSQNVQDVIVDLRYNGGGYVSLQSQFADYLVPTSGNGGVMEAEHFNDKYRNFDDTTFFTKHGSLNLSRVFFIVSQNTASASELLINSLKPYLNVQLIGPSTTDGKPVGFFPIPVENWYIFPVSFRTVNKNGEGNYFNGFSLNDQVMDGLDKQWGDVNESCLASALHYISTSSYQRAEVSGQSIDNNVLNGNTKLGTSRFKGMIGVKRNAPSSLHR